MVFAGTKRKMEELKANGSKITFIFHCSGFSIKTYFRDSERNFLSFFTIILYSSSSSSNIGKHQGKMTPTRWPSAWGVFSYKSRQNFQSLYETNPSNMKYIEIPRQQTA
jgi:hypothetical protein